MKKLFLFKELNEKAQLKAVEDYLNGWEETHGDKFSDQECFFYLLNAQRDYNMVNYKNEYLEAVRALIPVVYRQNIREEYITVERDIFEKLWELYNEQATEEERLELRLEIFDYTE